MSPLYEVYLINIIVLINEVTQNYLQFVLSIMNAASCPAIRLEHVTCASLGQCITQVELSTFTVGQSGLDHNTCL